MQTIQSFFILLFSVTLVSCNPDQVFKDYHSMGDEMVWHKKETQRFNVEIESPGKYDFSILLRHSVYYPNTGLFMKMSIKTPDRKRFVEPISVKVRDGSGYPLGSALGDIVDLEAPVATGVKLPVAGTYMFEIEHTMTREELPFIMELGLIVEKH